MPRTTALKLKLDAGAAWHATVLDMEDKRIAQVPVRALDDGAGVRVAQHPFERDALVVVEPAR